MGILHASANNALAGWALIGKWITQTLASGKGGARAAHVADANGAARARFAPPANVQNGQALYGGRAPAMRRAETALAVSATGGARTVAVAAANTTRWRSGEVFPLSPQASAAAFAHARLIASTAGQVPSKDINPDWGRDNINGLVPPPQFRHGAPASDINPHWHNGGPVPPPPRMSTAPSRPAFLASSPAVKDLAAVATNDRLQALLSRREKLRVEEVLVQHGQAYLDRRDIAFRARKGVLIQRLTGGGPAPSAPGSGRSGPKGSPSAEGVRPSADKVQHLAASGSFIKAARRGPVALRQYRSAEVERLQADVDVRAQAVGAQWVSLHARGRELGERERALQAMQEQAGQRGASLPVGSVAGTGKRAEQPPHPMERAASVTHHEHLPSGKNDMTSIIAGAGAESRARTVSIDLTRTIVHRYEAPRPECVRNAPALFNTHAGMPKARPGGSLSELKARIWMTHDPDEAIRLVDKLPARARDSTHFDP